MGYPGQLGHVDFYPNGGKEQPNCDPKGRMKGVQLIYSIQHLFVASCSHSRAPMFFTKSIKSQVVACRCSSWAEFRKACKINCRDQIIFGEHVSPTARGKYFLDMAI
ncbi:unnamed protein product [Allacma fusca]|uniref:Lipase domain-containing protein n=1 Tax=Allacma fusca TaxID=39272 RepID=A0A8J2LIS6_9HEXA|nr:unnamed protein product [Allacma fusca]